jgi:hypothetical protein
MAFALRGRIVSCRVRAERKFCDAERASRRAYVRKAGDGTSGSRVDDMYVAGARATHVGALV